jgi:hypothetical protein
MSVPIVFFCLPLLSTGFLKQTMIMKWNPPTGITSLSLAHFLSLTLLLLSPVPADGIEIIKSDFLSCDLSGHLKEFYLGIHDNPFDSGHDGGLSVLRLILTGTVLEKASFEFHLVEAGFINPQPSTPSGFGVFSQVTRFKTDEWTHTQTTHKDFLAQIAIDRANFVLELSHFDLTVGRQAISLGTTYFWNPNDLLTTFSPYEFDRDYKPGVDGIKADIALGDFSGISLIYGAGESFKLDESALLARVFGNMLDFDIAMMAGRYREDGFAGADFSGEVGPGIGVRGGLSYFATESDDDFIQVVVGGEYRFENNFYLSAEYFYNGFGTPHTSRYIKKLSSERFQAGDFFNISRHYLGILGSYEVTPLLRVSLATIINIIDHSVLVDPTIIFSLSDNADLVAGMVIGEGKEPRGFTLESEFGAYPDFTFVEIKYYF